MKGKQLRCVLNVINSLFFDVFQATVKFNHGDVKCKRYYFKLKVGPGNHYTMDFSKHAIECPLYEKQMLIWYQGDDKAVVDFSHGSSKDAEKESNRAAPAEPKQAKTVSEKLPDEEEDEMSFVPTTVRERYVSDIPKTIEQPVHNSDLLSLEAVHNLAELRTETNFVSDIHLAPGLLVTCFHESKFQTSNKVTYV